MTIRLINSHWRIWLDYYMYYYPFNYGLVPSTKYPIKLLVCK